MPLTAANRQAAQGSYARETQNPADVLNLHLRVDWLGAVVLLSADYHRQLHYVVGVYGFPQVGEFRRYVWQPLFRLHPSGNVRARVADMVYFANQLKVRNENSQPAKHATSR